MADREKVIEGLQKCAAIHQGFMCESCEYPGDDCAVDDALALLKAQEPATVEPKRIELVDETKAWLDKMNAVDVLGNIANICIDWDGYRTADGLGGLINEIWAYARYCADRLEKAQEPVKPKIVDTSNSKLYHNDMFKNHYCGNCGEFLHVVNRKDMFCSQCGRAVKWG